MWEIVVDKSCEHACSTCPPKTRSPSCDDVIQRHFTYQFEYEFPDTDRLTWQQKEEKFQQFLLDFPSQCDKLIEIESMRGSPASYPWVKATSMDWATVRKFVGAVRRRFKGKPGYHFEEDYSHGNP